MENYRQDLDPTVNMRQQDDHPQSSSTSSPAVAAAAVTCNTGGESDLPPTPATVTSSSPNTPSSSSSAFQPYQQQLHEAMLAAVNSHGIPSFTSHNLIAAAAAVAAAAAAAAASASPTPSSQDNCGSPTQPSRPRQEIDVVKRDSIRAANRERKKKWRIHNEERNKDNDLRCRVNKRASKLFGQADSDAKRKWAQEEFEKRRQKRMEKERRKNMIDNVLSVPGSPSHPSSGTPASSQLAQSPQQQHHQQQQQDAAAAAAAIAASLASAAASAAAGTSSSTGATDQLGYYMAPPPAVVDTSAASKMLDFPPELQRQLLEQLNNMIALTNAGKLGTGTSDFGQPQAPDVPHSAEGEGETGALQHQVPPSSVDMIHAVKTDMAQDEQSLSMGASSSSSNSGQNSPVPLTQSSAVSHQGTTTMSANEQQQQLQQNERSPEMKQDEKKPEYPMDAVLTLMQLNAGWRQ